MRFVTREGYEVFDCIILGGSFAGLSAGLALARAMRNVLILDTGRPCNYMVDHAHNFLGYDGEKPSEILTNSRKKLLDRYATIKIVNEKAVKLEGSNGKFAITTEQGIQFNSKKVILATGVTEVMPDISGFAEAWGRSILHCPYCHGYEHIKEKAMILGNGDYASMKAKMISHWNPDLTILTNGKSTIKDEDLLKKKGIKVIETKVKSFDVDENGKVQRVHFEDGTKQDVQVVYTHNKVKQSMDLAEKLGCKMKDGLVEADQRQKTSIEGVYVAGDAQTLFRTLATAVNSGMIAGAMCNNELIFETFA